jgi:excisionase family DNA binding protein
MLTTTEQDASRSPYLTSSEAADHCRVSLRTLMKKVDSGHIPCVRFSTRKLLFKRDAIDEALGKLTTTR